MHTDGILNIMPLKTGRGSSIIIFLCRIFRRNTVYTHAGSDPVGTWKKVDYIIVRLNFANYY